MSPLADHELATAMRDHEKHRKASRSEMSTSISLVARRSSIHSSMEIAPFDEVLLTSEQSLSCEKIMRSAFSCLESTSVVARV